MRLEEYKSIWQDIALTSVEVPADDRVLIPIATRQFLNTFEMPVQFEVSWGDFSLISSSANQGLKTVEFYSLLQAIPGCGLYRCLLVLMGATKYTTLA